MTLDLVPILTIIFFVLGLIIGSFLNVVICRLNTRRSLGGRSACMACEKKLSWYELVPLFSFLILCGRCKGCKTKISIQYPLVELATGIIFAVLFLKFYVLGGQDFFVLNLSFFVTYLYYAIIFSLLVVVAAYDLRHKIIPDTLSFVLGILGFVGLFFFNNNNFFWHMPSLMDFLSGILVSLPFALLWLVSQGRWMGLGDAKLALGLGWILGLSRALSALVIAFWSGAVIGLLLVFFRKGYGMKSEIPFALYLVLGAFISFVFDLHLFPIFN